MTRIELTREEMFILMQWSGMHYDGENDRHVDGFQEDGTSEDIRYWPQHAEASLRKKMIEAWTGHKTLVRVDKETMWAALEAAAKGQ